MSAVSPVCMALKTRLMLESAHIEIEFPPLPLTYRLEAKRAMSYGDFSAWTDETLQTLGGSKWKDQGAATPRNWTLHSEDEKTIGAEDYDIMKLKDCRVLVRYHPAQFPEIVIFLGRVGPARLKFGENGRIVMNEVSQHSFRHTATIGDVCSALKIRFANLYVVRQVRYFKDSPALGEEVHCKSTYTISDRLTDIGIGNRSQFYTK